jgi:hypothetical protein
MDVGGFRILSELRAGGLGTWYSAEHLATHRQALVKLMRPELTRSEAVARFAEEIRTFALLAHPALARVYDAGVAEDGRVYVAIEKVSGRTLRERLDAGPPLTPTVVMAIVRQVAHGLGAAHLAGLTHHNLEPANLVVDETGTKACVLDFAVARLVADLPDRERAATYLAPEQMRGASSVDHRADVYALGCIAYEMLAGKPPHTDEAGHQFAETAPLPERVPAGLRALVAGMLAKDPTARPQTMEHVVAELDKLDAPRGEAPPDALEKANAVRWGVAEATRVEKAARRSATQTAGRRMAIFVAATGAALVIVVIGSLVARTSTSVMPAAASCEGGDGPTCFTDGLRLGDGQARAEKFQRACQLGYGPGCTAAGSLAEVRGEGTQADDWFHRGCEAGDGQGCAHLGRRTSEKDPERAEGHFRRGCDLGAAAACTRLGDLFASNDPDIAAGYLQRGCDGNDGNACYRLASLYQMGRGVERDTGKAAMLAQRACALEATLCPKD